MNDVLTSVKKFYLKHERKIVYSALAVTTTGMLLFRSGVKAQNKFLKEKGLYDEYYYLDEE